MQYPPTFHTSDIPSPLFTFLYKNTSFFDYPQKTFKIILHSQQNPLPLSHQIKNKKHQPLKNIEDRIINVEHKRRNVEHKSPNVEHKTLNVEHKIIDMNKKSPNVQHKSLDVEHKRRNVEHGVINVECESATNAKHYCSINFVFQK